MADGRRTMKFKLIIINNIIAFLLNILAIMVNLLGSTDLVDQIKSFIIVVMICLVPRYIYKYLFKKEIYVEKQTDFKTLIYIILGAIGFTLLYLIMTGSIAPIYFVVINIYLAGYILYETIVCSILLLKENADVDSNTT